MKMLRTLLPLPFLFVAAALGGCSASAPAVVPLDSGQPDVVEPADTGADAADAADASDGDSASKFDAGDSSPPYDATDGDDSDDASDANDGDDANDASDASDGGDGSDAGPCGDGWHPFPACDPSIQDLECFAYLPYPGRFERCCSGVWVNEPTDAGYECPPQGAVDAGAD
jgi:hypothetical protein